MVVRIWKTGFSLSGCLRRDSSSPDSSPPGRIDRAKTGWFCEEFTHGRRTGGIQTKWRKRDATRALLCVLVCTAHSTHSVGSNDRILERGYRKTGVWMTKPHI